MFTKDIKSLIQRRIESGELSEGEQIPSEFELMRTLNVSRAHAREALVELEMEGYIFRYQGRGSFVAPSEHRITRLGIKGFRIVAMSCNRLSSRYRQTVLDAFSDELHEHGIQTLIYFLDQTGDAEKRFLEGIRTSGVEGLALWLRDRSDDMRSVLKTFQDGRFPFVLCDRYFPGFEADSVSSNNAEIGYELTLGLIARGFSRIAFLGSMTRMTATEEREAGFRRALAETGLPPVETHICWPEGSVAGVVKALMAHRARPTALVCCDDHVAADAVNELLSLGYALPRDMALAAVDDDRRLRDFGLPVVSIQQDGATIGRETARLLMARMANPCRDAEKVVVEAHMEHHYTDEGYLFGQSAVGCADWQ